MPGSAFNFGPAVAPLPPIAGRLMVLPGSQRDRALVKPYQSNIWFQNRSLPVLAGRIWKYGASSEVSRGGLGITFANFSAFRSALVLVPTDALCVWQQVGDWQTSTIFEQVSVTATGCTYNYTCAGMISVSRSGLTPPGTVTYSIDGGAPISINFLVDAESGTSVTIPLSCVEIDSANHTIAFTWPSGPAPFVSFLSPHVVLVPKLPLGGGWVSNPLSHRWSKIGGINGFPDLYASETAGPLTLGEGMTGVIGHGSGNASATQQYLNGLSGYPLPWADGATISGQLPRPSWVSAPYEGMPFVGADGIHRKTMTWPRNHYDVASAINLVWDCEEMWIALPPGFSIDLELRRNSDWGWPQTQTTATMPTVIWSGTIVGGANRLTSIPIPRLLPGPDGEKTGMVRMFVAGSNSGVAVIAVNKPLPYPFAIGGPDSGEFAPGQWHPDQCVARKGNYPWVGAAPQMDHPGPVPANTPAAVIMSGLAAGVWQIDTWDTSGTPAWVATGSGSFSERSMRGVSPSGRRAEATALLTAGGVDCFLDIAAGVAAPRYTKWRATAVPITPRVLAVGSNPLNVSDTTWGQPRLTGIGFTPTYSTGYYFQKIEAAAAGKYTVALPVFLGESSIGGQRSTVEVWWSKTDPLCVDMSQRDTFDMVQVEMPVLGQAILMPSGPPAAVTTLASGHSRSLYYLVTAANAAIGSAWEGKEGLMAFGQRLTSAAAIVWEFYEVPAGFFATATPPDSSTSTRYVKLKKDWQTEATATVEISFALAAGEAVFLRIAGCRSGQSSRLGFPFLRWIDVAKPLALGLAYTAPP